jgi:hypothetical protein
MYFAWTFKLFLHALLKVRDEHCACTRTLCWLYDRVVLRTTSLDGIAKPETVWCLRQTRLQTTKESLSFPFFSSYSQICSHCACKKIVSFFRYPPLTVRHSILYSVASPLWGVLPLGLSKVPLDDPTRSSVNCIVICARSTRLLTLTVYFFQDTLEWFICWIQHSLSRWFLPSPLLSPCYTASSALPRSGGIKPVDRSESRGFINAQPAGRYRKTFLSPHSGGCS